MELKLSLLINAIIFLATTSIVISYFFKRKTQTKALGARSFKYFTTISNVSAALTSLAVIIAELAVKSDTITYPHVLVHLKLMSTVAVTLTLVTSIFHLGPVFGFGHMFGGTNFYMHLAGPLLAIYAFCFLENFDSLTVEESIVAVVPSLIYYMVYVRQVIFVQRRDASGHLERGWEDFYGFNRGGRWPLVLVLMLAVILGISLGLRLLYNV